jgi:two-component sensor histidine kinase
LVKSLAEAVGLALDNSRLYAAAQSELAERKRAEDKLRSSLAEKEVLLKEIHHRVKNNLQVISSLLYLQSKDIADAGVRALFLDSQNRVRSMALVHERLYRSEDLAKVDFAEYVRSLAASLIRSYRVNTNGVKLAVDVEEVYLSVDAAVPCGLIINELISNCLKHAFPDGRAGEIRVELRRAGGHKLSLTVTDDGVGFPQDLKARPTSSLGLQLVHTLTEQLGGQVELSGDVGTVATVRFPAEDQSRNR